VTPLAKVTSVSSRSKNCSLPEYTAELGILGRIWERCIEIVIVLTALALRYGVNVWMERRRLKVKDLVDVVLLETKFKLNLQCVWMWCS
jgi:hypothetical protein